VLCILSEYTTQMMQSCSTSYSKKARTAS
jgi:hypothetical protein